ncbi:SDR family oxidoreductase [Streptomyces tendae]|uniref:SDR family oxidoreductase n=1 Tax=Streptomyces tendae TaxID=1932 RepID=UPI003722B698
MYDELFAINVKGVFFTVQKLAPLAECERRHRPHHLDRERHRHGGHQRLRGRQRGAGSMARSFSRELLPRGIRVNAISPGPIDSGILETVNLSQEAADRFRAERTSSNPMKRYGTVEEFAKAAAFLAFDATYTTGIELAVDGGETQL